MNRRSMFRLLPVAPLIGATAVLAAVKPKVQVKLPQAGDLDWGTTINNAILQLQEEINKRG